MESRVHFVFLQFDESIIEITKCVKTKLGLVGVRKVRSPSVMTSANNFHGTRRYSKAVGGMERRYEVDALP